MLSNLNSNNHTLNRLVEFDIAKALCIILVVVGHYAVEKPAWWITIHDIIYTFHMPLFMFASGFIYNAFKKEESYGHFLLKKVKRLMVPYFSTSIIVITFKLVSQSFLYVQNPVTALSYLKILYLPEAGYYLWFIWALWWMFFLVPLLKTRSMRLFVFVIAIVLHVVSPYLGLTEVFCIKETAKMLIWFMLGVICFDWNIQLNKVKKVHIIVILIVFVTVLFVNGTGNLPSLGTNEWLIDSYMEGVINLLQPCLGIILVILLSKWISKQKRGNFLLIVAGCSYLIYLFHTTFMGLVKALIMKMPYINSLSVIAIFIVVLSGVLCPILLHRVFDKSKVTRFLFGINK